MTTETVKDLRNQIRDKISEQQDLKEQIETLNQQVEAVRELETRRQERLNTGERNNYTTCRRELETDIRYAKNTIRSIAEDISILKRRIETIGVGELLNKVERKLGEIQGLKIELVELNQELKNEIERVEVDKEEARRGKSIKWEELEWDICCTELAISGITNEVEVLKDQIYKILSGGASRRVARE